MTIEIQKLSDMEELSRTVSERIILDVRKSLKTNVRASIMLSGGSTPRMTYEALGKSVFDWRKVNVGLVDDRWVDESSPGSNAAMIRECFVDRANFPPRLFPLKNQDASLERGCEASNLSYFKIQRPFSSVTLGMGMDGHTASWFPNAVGIDRALNPRSSKLVVPVRPHPSEVTGEYLERATLTLSAVSEARNIYLLLSGQNKLDLFTDVLDDPDSSLPIRKTTDVLGNKLTVFWAP